MADIKEKRWINEDHCDQKTNDRLQEKKMESIAAMGEQKKYRFPCSSDGSKQSSDQTDRKLKSEKMFRWNKH